MAEHCFFQAPNVKKLAFALFVYSMSNTQTIFILISYVVSLVIINISLSRYVGIVVNSFSVATVFLSEHTIP